MSFEVSAHDAYEALKLSADEVQDFAMKRLTDANLEALYDYAKGIEWHPADGFSLFLRIVREREVRGVRPAPADALDFLIAS